MMGSRVLLWTGKSRPLVLSNLWESEMCQATVFMKDQEIAREVIWLEPAENGVRLATFFEEPQIVCGRVCHIDFLKHRVLLEPLEEEDDGGN
jgi:predicted RNA-binding protein